MPHGATPFPFGQCRICNDKATGIHYGVATCEGCKGFFKRSLPKYESYKCFFGGLCEVTPANRNKCKSCRFKKCLDNGMSVEAIKMGRIPKMEKEQALEAGCDAQLVEEDSGCGSSVSTTISSSCDSYKSSTPAAPLKSSDSAVSVSVSCQQSDEKNTKSTSSPSVYSTEIIQELMSQVMKSQSNTTEAEKMKMKVCVSTGRDGFEENSCQVNSDNHRRLVELWLNKRSGDHVSPPIQPKRTCYDDTAIPTEYGRRHSKRGASENMPKSQESSHCPDITAYRLYEHSIPCTEPHGFNLTNGDVAPGHTYNDNEQLKHEFDQYLCSFNHSSSQQQCGSSNNQTFESLTFHKNPHDTHNQYNENYESIQAVTYQAQNLFVSNTKLDKSHVVKQKTSTQQVSCQNVNENYTDSAEDEATIIIKTFWEVYYLMKDMREKMRLRQQGVKFPDENIPVCEENKTIIWGLLMSSVGVCNHKMTEFAAAIPGFSLLPSCDQQSLAKNAYYKIWMAIYAGLFENGDQHLMFANGKRYSLEWMTVILPKNLVDEMFAFTEQFNNVQLTDTELPLLCAVLVTSCDDGVILTESDSAKKLHEHMLDVFAAEVGKNHQNSGRLLIDIFNKVLPHLRAMCKLQESIIGNFKVDKP